MGFLMYLTHSYSYNVLIVYHENLANDGKPKTGWRCLFNHWIASLSPGYPQPKSQSTSSFSLNYHDSNIVSLVTLATIEAADTTGKRESALDLTINFIPNP